MGEKGRNALPKEKGKWVKGKAIDPIYDNFNVWEWERMDSSNQNKWDLDITGHWDTGSIWKRTPDKRLKIDDNVYENWYFIEGEELKWHPEAKNDSTYGWWEGMSHEQRKKTFVDKRAWEEMERANKNTADDTFKED